MSILTSKQTKEDKATANYRNIVSKNVVLIFTRNPELGKCKSRLAATVGKQSALDIYNFLLNHTVAITEKLNCAKQVWYSEEIWETDIWDNTIFDKKLQEGEDLGIRMGNAIQTAFDTGYEKIIVIGSDMYDLATIDFENAFNSLDTCDFVVGPAEDGGYYLLGMKHFKPELFKNKNWGNDTVLTATLNNLENEKYHLLDERNDVDLYEDIKDIDAFKPFIKHIVK